jgi:hypothetical protein
MYLSQGGLNKVIGNFEKLAAKVGGDKRVEMRLGSMVSVIALDGEGCVGCMYFMAVAPEREWKKRGKGWIDGANLMAKDLGFVGYKALEWWALDNPEIWGNKYGDYIFQNYLAWGAEKLSLSDVIDHLKGVRDRAFQVEEEEEMCSYCGDLIGECDGGICVPTEEEEVFSMEYA